MSHARYTIHPTQDHIVMTPDGGVIECKHSAAAQRVCEELNERNWLLSEALHHLEYGQPSGADLHMAIDNLCAERI